jgi:replicative DNA helicase
MLPATLESELLKAGEVTVLAGRPGQGKTSLALQLALKAIGRKKSAAIFTLKTAKARLLKRLLCLETGIPLTAAMSDDIAKADKKRAAATLKHLTKAPLGIFDSAASVKEIGRLSRKIGKNGKLGLIVIDYLELISEVQDDKSAKNTSAVTRDLKDLAKELNTPVLILSLSKSRADTVGVVERDIKKVALNVNRAGRDKKIRLQFDRFTGILSKP